MMTVAFDDALAAIPDSAPPLTVLVGMDQHTQKMRAIDLAKAPHGLLAGVTGSGKSVGLNGMLATMLKRNSPEDLRLWMIDPKRVELAMYRRSAFVDHVVTDMDEAADMLSALVDEMERRYVLLEDWEVKNVADYAEASGESLPHIVAVVDEMADLMDTHRKVTEPLIVRLGQKARAAGIHMLLATQRPAADTIPKKILANVPTRVSYRTQSHVESNLILGERGAEDLDGKGDLLIKAPEYKGLIRAQGPYLSDDELREIIAEHPTTDPMEDVDTSTPEPDFEEESNLDEAPRPRATWHGVDNVSHVDAPQHDMGEIIARAITETATQTRKADLEEIDRLKRRIEELGADNDKLNADLEHWKARAATSDAAVRTLKETVNELEALRVEDEDHRRHLERGHEETLRLDMRARLLAARNMAVAFAFSLIVVILAVASMADAALLPAVAVASVATSVVVGWRALASALRAEKIKQKEDWGGREEPEDEDQPMGTGERDGHR